MRNDILSLRYQWTVIIGGNHASILQTSFLLLSPLVLCLILIHDHLLVTHKISSIYQSHLIIYEGKFNDP